MSRARFVFVLALMVAPGAVVEGCSGGTDYQGGKRTLPTEVPTTQTGEDGAVIDTGKPDNFAPPDNFVPPDTGADASADG
jgi:hypothetical protein